MSPEQSTLYRQARIAFVLDCLVGMLVMVALLWTVAAVWPYAAGADAAGPRTTSSTR